jgi:hypothetical protein
MRSQVGPVSGGGIPGGNGGRVLACADHGAGVVGEGTLCHHLLGSLCATAVVDGLDDGLLAAPLGLRAEQAVLLDVRQVGWTIGEGDLSRVLSLG